MNIINLINALPGAAAQGLIWGIMAIGVYLTFRILDVADLTVDGTMCTGGAVCIMMMQAGLYFILKMSIRPYTAGITLQTRLVVICAKMMKRRVMTRRNLLSTIIENALMGFATPVAAKDMKPIRPRSIVIGASGRK